MRFTKWGGKRHWHYSLEPLGSDEFGWWLGGRAGIPMRRGDEEPIAEPHDFVTLVPAAGGWIANWNGSIERRTAVYVDVTTEPVRYPDAVEAVDLDLDVVLLRDGAVLVLDEDEFAEHQVLYHYPAEVITAARATTRDLVAMISAGVEPFGEVGMTWLTRFARRSRKGDI